MSDIIDELMTCLGTHEPDSRVLGNVKAGDAIAALNDLSARLREAERKARCFDAIERRLVFIDACTTTIELVEWTAWADQLGIPSTIAAGRDLLTAIEAALAAKETK